LKTDPITKQFLPRLFGLSIALALAVLGLAYSLVFLG